jgi:hypothetical protein
MLLREIVVVRKYLKDSDDGELQLCMLIFWILFFVLFFFKHNVSEIKSVTVLR